jgi:hypothetical protein
VKTLHADCGRSAQRPFGCLSGLGHLGDSQIGGNYTLPSRLSARSALPQSYDRPFVSTRFTVSRITTLETHVDRAYDAVIR